MEKILAIRRLIPTEIFPTRPSIPHPTPIDPTHRIRLLLLLIRTRRVQLVDGHRMAAAAGKTLCRNGPAVLPPFPAAELSLARYSSSMRCLLVFGPVVRGFLLTVTFSYFPSGPVLDFRSRGILVRVSDNLNVSLGPDFMRILVSHLSQCWIVGVLVNLPFEPLVLFAPLHNDFSVIETRSNLGIIISRLGWCRPCTRSSLSPHELYHLRYSLIDPGLELLERICA